MKFSERKWEILSNTIATIFFGIHLQHIITLLKEIICRNLIVYCIFLTKYIFIQFVNIISELNVTDAIYVSISNKEMFKNSSINCRIIQRVFIQPISVLQLCVFCPPTPIYDNLNLSESFNHYHPRLFSF